MQLFRTLPLILLYFVFLPRTCATEELTSQQVLTASEALLAGPIRYRLRNGATDAIVSRTVLGEGTKVIRVDPVPGSQTMLIVIGKTFFEVLADSQVVINKNEMLEPNGEPLALGLLGRNDSGLSFLPESRTVFESCASVTTEALTIEGRSCYKITRLFTSPLDRLSEKIKRSPIFQDAIETTQSLLVDSSSFEPISLESVTETGKVINRFDYLDVQVGVDLASSDFSLPESYSVEIPKNRQEYYELHAKFWNDIRPVPNFRPIYPAAEFQSLANLYTEMKERTRVIRDAETGLFHLPGTSVAQARSDAFKAQKELMIEPPPQRHGYRIFLVANIIFFLGAFVYLMRRRHSS